MKDYSESLIGLTAAIKEYRKVVLKNQWKEAQHQANKITLYAKFLEEYTEQQCTETKNS